MTKTNQNTFDTIEAANLGLTEDQLKFIKDTLAAAAKKPSANSEHPDILNEDGTIKEKWCGKHLMYESIEKFTMKANDKYDANCDVAIKQWRAYTKIIKDLEKLTMGVINEQNPENLQSHMMKVEAAKTERQGAYEYPTEEVELEEAEAIVEKPKTRKRKTKTEEA